jgi:hypothetical protein
MCGSSAAALTHKLRVPYKVFIVREILLDVSGVLQKTEMLFVPWMGHLNLGHAHPLLPLMKMRFLSKDSRTAVRYSRDISSCA